MLHLLYEKLPDIEQVKAMAGKGQEARGRGNLFYGWIIVIGAWWMLVVVYATRLYSFPVFFPHLLKEMGWTRATTQLGLSANTFLYGGFSPILGWLLPKMGARPMMLMGCVIAAIGLFLMGTITSLWQFVLYYGIILAFGACAMAMLPNNTVVSNWFSRRRGTALGIINTGIGFGGATGALLASMLIEAYGWRMAFWWLAGIMLVLGSPVAIFVMRTRPEDMGLLPDGDKPGEVAGDTPAKPAKKMLIT